MINNSINFQVNGCRSAHFCCSGSCRRVSVWVRWTTLALKLIMILGMAIGGIEGMAIAQPQSGAHAATSPAVPFFEGLGQHHHPISTSNPLAQRYFDQGVILSYGFNHPEALRSFQAGIRLDPNCAMCYWGLAYVLGPNINAAMEDAALPTAWEAIQTAINLSDGTSENEQAYIHALAQRYAPAVTTATPEAQLHQRTALNLAYAKAMQQVAQRYPADLDAQTLSAEAWMDTTPWRYWQDNGEPTPTGVAVIATLKTVLDQDPDHLGALHLFIHVMEAKHPEWAEAAADRLRALQVKAGHLVHMPSHIYIRVGRYQDAIAANQQAIEEDARYAQIHPAEGIYKVAYMPHNHHFLWYAAMMAGQQDLALAAAQQTAAGVDWSLIREPGYGTLQHYAAIPLYTWTKFAQWDDILAQPAPDADLLYLTGVWHFARGMAFTAQGTEPAAAQELACLRSIMANPALAGITIWDINSTAHLLQIASEVLAGELAQQQGDSQQAIAHLQAGVALEDRLNYDEPAPWYFPVRQALAAALLDADRPAEAEQVYRQDLQTYPNNGWSLSGLAQSLMAQGKTDAAEALQQQLQDVAHQS